MSGPTRPASSGPTDDGAPAAISDRNDLDTAFVNLANVVAMLNWHFLDGSRRVTNAQGREVYEVSLSDGDQMLGLLHIADSWAASVVRDTAPQGPTRSARSSLPQPSDPIREATS